jgi:glutathione S-transferase
MGLESDKGTSVPETPSSKLYTNLSTDFTLHETDFETVHDPEWLEHQPFGQMPWMEDTETGIEMFESRAIVACKSFHHVLGSRS